MLVVRGRDDVGLIAIVVKHPRQRKLRTCANVVGHAFYHAMARKAFNVGTDMVLVTSFEESFLGSLRAGDFTHPDSYSYQDKSEMEIEDGSAMTQQNSKQKGEHQEIEDKGESVLSPQSQSPPQMKKSPSVRITNLENTDAPPFLDKETQSYSTTKFEPSHSEENRMLSSMEFFVNIPFCSQSEQNGMFTKNLIEPKLYVSKHDYKAHELVKLVYTALKISKKAYQKFEKKTYQLHRGKRYYFSRALSICGSDGEGLWGPLEATIGKPIHVLVKNPPREGHETAIPSNDGMYFVIASLGQGTKSNTFQALDHLGKPVAIKVMNGQDDDEAETAARPETENLERCYHFLEGRVRQIKMCGYHAVVMPMFDPIPNDDRPKRLDGVRSALTNMKDRIGKLYHTWDARWRHVGIFKENGQEHLVLFDLADLQDLDECSDTDDSDTETKSEGSTTKEMDRVQKLYDSFARRCSEHRPTNTPTFFSEPIQKLG